MKISQPFHSPISVEDFHRRLDALFPEFGEAFADSLFVREDGSFTPHGLCLEFSIVYERVGDFSSPRIARLFETIEVIVAADHGDWHPLANAVKTCFLESLALTNAGEASRTLMGPATRAFFEGWHGPPPYSR